MQPEQPNEFPPPAADDAPAGGEAPPPPPPFSGTGAGPGEGGGWVPSFQILRSRHDRKLGGVGGGLAAAANLDPTVVRLAIILGCLTGWGILAYFIAWAVIPEEDPAKGRYLMPAPEPAGKYLRIGMLVGAGLGVLQVLGAILGVVSSALIGIGLFPAHVFGLANNDGFEAGEALLGLLLLIGGLLLVFRHHLPWVPAPDTGTGTGTGAGAGTAGSWAPPSPPATGMALATITPGSGGTGATAGPGGPAGTYGAAPPGSGAAGSAGFSARASAAARMARTNGPLLLVRATGWLVGLWFLAAAVIAGVFWLTGALDVRLPVLPIVTSLAAVGALGYALVRSRRLAVVIAAMALLLVPTGLAAALVRVDGQAGDRSVTPTVMSDLQREYRHAIGVLTIDLSKLQLPPGQTPIDVKMGAGKVEVTVPWDANVEASASVAAGSFDLFGNRQTGVNLDGRSRSTGQPGAPLLVFNGEAGAGEIVLRRADEPSTRQALRTGQPVPMDCSGPMPPYRRHAYGLAPTGPVRCFAADGVTTDTPALGCVVSAGGWALCRPVGEPEPAVDFANDSGTRRCQVPAGGGEATCTAPIPVRNQTGGTFTCTIPEGGGEAVCRPAGTEPPAPEAPPVPAPPADPNAPSATTTTSPPPAPGEYRCTVPEGGGPATCEPI